MSSPDELLDTATVVSYLAELGLIDGDGARAEALGGGVSNTVLAVTDASCSLVVKQALGLLRVAERWEAPRRRAVTEAEALRRLHAVTPHAVPPVVHVDPGRSVVVLQRAPEGWRDWKSHLLRGAISVPVAARLGAVLARWHNHTFGGEGLSAGMVDPSAFEQLRVDPYYRTVARRAPETAGALAELIDGMGQRRLCLVDGDLSPKNVLVSPAQTESWVIDLEVAHLGDPAFDLAFLLSHLMLKSLRQPGDAAALDRCARAFTHGYGADARAELAPDWAYVNAHVGALLLARVRGKSPVEYLDEPGAARAWALGLALLRHPPATPEGLAAAREATGA